MIIKDRGLGYLIDKKIIEEKGRQITSYSLIMYKDQSDTEDLRQRLLLYRYLLQKHHVPIPKLISSRIHFNLYNRFTYELYYNEAYIGPTFVQITKKKELEENIKKLLREIIIPLLKSTKSKQFTIGLNADINNFSWSPITDRFYYTGLMPPLVPYKGRVETDIFPVKPRTLGVLFPLRFHKLGIILSLTTSLIMAFPDSKKLILETLRESLPIQEKSITSFFYNNNKLVKNNYRLLLDQLKRFEYLDFHSYRNLLWAMTELCVIDPDFRLKLDKVKEYLSTKYEWNRKTVRFRSREKRMAYEIIFNSLKNAANRKINKR
jgi:hypothetical protein